MKNIFQIDVQYRIYPRYKAYKPDTSETPSLNPDVIKLQYQLEYQLDSVYSMLTQKNFSQRETRIPFSNEATCTLEGFVQENGRNVVGLSVPVILITTQGLFLQRTVTNQEGFFRFRRVPLDLSVLVIAVDTTYKYNAVVFANIKTLESNYD